MFWIRLPDSWSGSDRDSQVTAPVLPRQVNWDPESQQLLSEPLGYALCYTSSGFTQISIPGFVLGTADW